MDPVTAPGTPNPPTKPRDEQKSRVYSAEQMFRTILDDHPIMYFAGSTIPVPLERKFGNLESIRRYADYVVRVYGAPEVTIRERKGDTKAHYERDTHTIAVPVPHRLSDAWSMREIVILHELTHHLCSGPGHGPEFALKFTQLVGRMMGENAQFMLTTLMYQHHVKFR